MGDGNFRPPTESTPFDRSPKNLLLVITSATPTAVANLVQIRLWGASGQMGEIYLFIYLFFFINSPTGQTRRRIFTLNGSNDVDSRKDVPFGGVVDIVPHFGGEIPRKPQFLGRE